MAKLPSFNQKSDQSAGMRLHNTQSCPSGGSCCSTQSSNDRMLRNATVTLPKETELEDPCLVLSMLFFFHLFSSMPPHFRAWIICFINRDAGVASCEVIKKHRCALV